jgi:hypothetical protein
VTWEAIGAIGEVLGALGVIATLGYLAVQVRQNTRTSRASALSLALRDISELTNHNERYVASLHRAEQGEALSSEEAVHMVERHVSIMRTYENFWLQWQLGSLTEEQFGRYADTLRWTLSVRTARKLWRAVQSCFDPGFVAYVEAEALAEGAPTSSLLSAFTVLRDMPTGRSGRTPQREADASEGAAAPDSGQD